MIRLAKTEPCCCDSCYLSLERDRCVQPGWQRQSHVAVTVATTVYKDTGVCNQFGKDRAMLLWLLLPQFIETQVCAIRFAKTEPCCCDSYYLSLLRHRCVRSGWQGLSHVAVTVATSVYRDTDVCDQVGKDWTMLLWLLLPQFIETGVCDLVGKDWAMFLWLLLPRFIETQVCVIMWLDLQRLSHVNCDCVAGAWGGCHDAEWCHALRLPADELRHAGESVGYGTISSGSSHINVAVENSLHFLTLSCWNKSWSNIRQHQPILLFLTLQVSSSIDLEWRLARNVLLTVFEKCEKCPCNIKHLLDCVLEASVRDSSQGKELK